MVNQKRLLRKWGKKKKRKWGRFEMQRMRANWRKRRTGRQHGICAIK